MLLLLLAVACGQNYNSDSGDGAGSVSADCSGANGVRLCAALKVLRTNRCYGCHNEFSSLSTDAAWEASPYIVQDQPLSSLLIQKLVNSGGDMPLDTGIAISTTDYNTLVDWIQNL